MVLQIAHHSLWKNGPQYASLGKFYLLALEQGTVRSARRRRQQQQQQQQQQPQLQYASLDKSNCWLWNKEQLDQQDNNNNNNNNNHSPSMLHWASSTCWFWNKKQLVHLDNNNNNNNNKPLHF